MTITDETAEAAREFGRLNIPGAAARIPEILTYQLPVPPGLDHEQKLAWLEQVAAEWETQTFTDEMGSQKAEQQFVALRLVASVSHPDGTVSGYLARAAALRAANAGSPAAA